MALKRWATTPDYPAANPLDGSETFGIVQAGVDVVATMDDIADLVASGVTDGDKGDIVVSGGGAVWSIEADAVGSAEIAANAVTDAELRDSAGLSVIGRSANSAGDPADILAASDGEVLRRSGAAVGFGTVATAGLTDNAVTDPKLRDSAALSVIGRGANSVGDPADIVAASDGEVLRRAGTTVGFGTIVTAGIADAAVTLAKQANLAEGSFIARNTSGTGVPEAVTTAQAQVRLLAPRVQSLVSSATVTPSFADDMVKITAQAAALALANPTGTAVEGHGIAIRIKDNGTARAISYGSEYRAIGVTLPTTTVISKTLYLGMVYNITDTKWDVLAVAQEA